jgi:four helix bundle protein
LEFELKIFKSSHSQIEKMAAYQKFEELDVWRDARKLVKTIYKATENGKFAKNYGLRDQLQRSAVSIMANVAEGFERGGNKEFTRFLYLAKGSAGEFRSHLYVALDTGFIDQGVFAEMTEHAVSISRQLSGFIKYLDRSERPRMPH